MKTAPNPTPPPGYATPLSQTDPRTRSEAATTAPAAGAEAMANSLQAAYAGLSKAEACRQGGDLARAQSLCEALLKQFPDYVGALQTLGVVHLQKSNFRQALSCFIRAAMHCPRDAVNLTNLATCYLRLGAHELAMQTLVAARRLAPDDPAIHWSLAEVHHAERAYEKAARAFEKVLALAPVQADAAHGLGDCLLHLGRTAEAAAALKRAHALKPYSAPILYTLCQLPAESVDVDLLQALGHVRRQEGQSQEEFDTRLAFARAAALDKLGRYEEAWEALLQANRREFPRHADACRRHRARMQAVRKAAEQEPARYANEGAELQPLSVFIIGPSRSGKTTLEHLAAEMKGVRRGFERRLIEPASQRASQLAGLPTISDPIELPKTLDARFREFYREELEEFAAGAGIVTDTHPAMIASVGRVAAAIPKVRFIFVKRDMFDVALRIFMKPYRTGNPYAYDIGTIFVHLSWYYDMIDLWCERFPDIAFSVDYEEMISQPGATSRRIADLCGVLAPESPLPDLGDDRNCSAPYRSFIQAELSRSRA